MTRNWLAILLLSATAACGAGSAPARPAGPPVAFTGAKGINLHNWFTWPKQTAPDRYASPAFQSPAGELTPAEAKRLHALGFDFVRLTVEPGVFMAATGADARQALDALTAGIDRLRAAGLSVIVDMHPNGRFQPGVPVPGNGAQALQRGASDPVAKRFEASAAALAGALDKRYGGSRAVAFELLNEPSLPCGAVSWRAQQAALRRAVRAAAPRLTLVLTGTCWSNIDGLTALKASDYADPNTLYTFHFYDEHRFTHQGTDKGGPDSATSGLPYPWDARPRAAVDADVDARLSLLPDGGVSERAAVKASVDKFYEKRFDRDAVERRMDQVAAWAKANDVAPDRILMGEFGVNGSQGAVMGANEADKLRWLSDVRTAAEARGFRWALWSYRGSSSDGFGLDSGLGADPMMLRALGLKS